MQGRAAAVYGLVFLLVAAGALGYAATVDAPEPSLAQVDYAAAEGDEISFGDRTYTVSGFDTQAGQPAATLVWTDEDARTTEEWEHAAEPGGTTVVYEGTEHWVRIPQVADPDSFTLVETPAEDDDVSVFADDEGTWWVNDGGEVVRLEAYEGLAQVERSNGSTFDVGAEDEVRTVTVEAVTNESVTVSWNEPAEFEAFVRQTTEEAGELNGRQIAAHFPGEGTLQLTTDEAAIEDYIEQRQDYARFQQRLRGVRMSAVLALVSVALLGGLAFLPRKE